MDQGTALLDLQETDLSLMRAEKRLDELPEKLAILETRKKAEEVRGLRAKAEELVAMLGRAVTKHEDECSSLDEKIASEQNKIMSGEVTNPKELQHISRELDALKRRKDKLEMEEIALMERVEKAKGQVDKVDVALGQLAEKESVLTDRFKAKGSELIDEIEQLKQHRASVAKGIEEGLLARYESARAAKAGIGVGRLDGATCTACRMELPAQRVDELRIDPGIAVCPQCKRLLVVTPQQED